MMSLGASTTHLCTHKILWGLFVFFVPLKRMNGLCWVSIKIAKVWFKSALHVKCYEMSCCEIALCK